MNNEKINIISLNIFLFLVRIVFNSIQFNVRNFCNFNNNKKLAPHFTVNK